MRTPLRRSLLCSMRFRNIINSSLAKKKFVISFRWMERISGFGQRHTSQLEMEQGTSCAKKKFRLLFYAYRLCEIGE